MDQKEKSIGLSGLMRALENTWAVISNHNLDVPKDVIIVIGSGGRRSATLLGHFAKNTWGDEQQEKGENVEDELHEVLLVAENLNRSAEDVFTTLLHEAVHGIAHVRGIRETSGPRHNKKFATLCEEVGLIPPEKPDAKIGFSAAKLSDEAKVMYSTEIEAIEAQLVLCRKLAVKTSKSKKTTWIAQCACFRKLRIPRKTIVDPNHLGVACSECGSEFEMDDDEIESFKETVSGAY